MLAATLAGAPDLGLVLTRRFLLCTRALDVARLATPCSPCPAAGAAALLPRAHSPSAAATALYPAQADAASRVRQVVAEVLGGAATASLADDTPLMSAGRW